MKRFVIIICLLIMALVVSCATEEYKITLIDSVTLEEVEYTSNKKEIQPLNLEVDLKEGYLFLGWSSDGINVLDDNELINLKETTTLYSIWQKKTNYASFFEIGSVGRIDVSVNDPITSKETYVTATISISKDDYQTEALSGKIRLRGNSSLSAPKKSYKLKFDKKQDVFGFGADKEWALIANYFDTSMVRNFYAYRLAQAMGIKYSVDCCFVELYLNGSYNGLYLFCETVKTGTNRVNIEEDYDETVLDIPFLLELDFKMADGSDIESLGVKDVDYFELDMRKEFGKVYPIACKYPKEYTAISDDQFDMIKTYVTTAFKSVNTDSYEYYFDLNSLVDYFLVQELMMNIDMDYSSVFFYRTSGGKIAYGPVWDFDISSGNCNYAGTYDPAKLMKDINGGSYIFNEMLKHEKFRTLFLARLNEVNEKIMPLLLASFKQAKEDLTSYAAKDNNKWNNLYASYWPKPDHLTNITYAEQVDYVKYYIEAHFAAMLRLI